MNANLAIGIIGNRDIQNFGYCGVLDGKACRRLLDRLSNVLGPGICGYQLALIHSAIYLLQFLDGLFCSVFFGKDCISTGLELATLLAING